MNLILYVLIVNLYIAFKLWWDWYARTHEKRVINHFGSGVFNFVLYVGSAFVLLYNRYPFDIFIAIVWMSFFWKRFAFNLGYNIIFNDEWNYCSDHSKIDDWVDNLDGKDDNICTYTLIVDIIGIGLGLIVILL